MPETYENSIGDNSGTIDAEALKGYIERAANVMQEQKVLGEDLKEICAQADEAGVASKKEIRRLARESLMDQEVLTSQLERMDALRRALGGFAETPLGTAAVEQLDQRRRRRSRKNGQEAAPF